MLSHGWDQIVITTALHSLRIDRDTDSLQRLSSLGWCSLMSVKEAELHMHSQAAKHIQSSRYGCFYYARVDENLPRMSDCRISASSLFNGALPYADRRMWLFFFAALLFLNATQTHAHTRTHRRSILHRRTADNLLLVVWSVPNPPPPGSA